MTPWDAVQWSYLIAEIRPDAFPRLRRIAVAEALPAGSDARKTLLFAREQGVEPPEISPPIPNPRPQKSLAAPYLPFAATLPPGRGIKAPI